jgi:hypothetical protein
MSIIVAALDEGEDTSDASVAAISTELVPGDEVIWVGLGQPPGALARARHAEPLGPGRGGLFAGGIQVARNPHVAFTDSRTLVSPGWRRSAGEALDRHPVVGGPVLPSGRRTVKSWAGFFVEYGPHATPPYTSSSGDVAANNVAYRHRTLADVTEPGAPVWKSEVNARLRSSGINPCVVEAMSVTSTKQYRWHELTSARMSHGRLFGAQQSTAKHSSERLLFVVRSFFLPTLAYLRLARIIARNRALWRRFIVATPLIVVALVAWSVGEAVGYATGREARDDVY